MTHPTKPSHPGRTLLIAGLSFLVLSLLLGILSVYSGTKTILQGVNIQEVSAVPVEVELKPGTWALYERDGDPMTGEDYGIETGSPLSEPTTLAPADVTVEGPSGRVRLEAVSSTESFTSEAGRYTAFAHFDVLEEGTYTLQADSGDTEVILSRSLGETFRSLGAAVLEGVGSALSGLLGFVLLVIGGVRWYSSRNTPRGGSSDAPMQPSQPGSWPTQPGAWPPSPPPASTWADTTGPSSSSPS